MNPRLVTVRLVVLIAIPAILFSCNDDNNPQVKVEITSITPASAFEGESVTINGASFSTTTSGNIVRFNGTSAPVISATSSQIQVSVPQGATTGKVTVEVGGQTATSPSDFIVRQTSLTGFSPESGFTGTAVTITGVDFVADLTANEVKFNGAAATVTNATASQLVVTVPENATSGKITVTTNGRTLTSASDFNVLELAITSFEPTAATVESNVVIMGANFSTDAAGNVVKFGDAEAEIIDASSTKITVAVPLEAETGIISVTTGGKTATSTNEFVVLVPVIHDFSPLTGVAGMEITISGENFSPNIEENSVVFVAGDATAKILSASETQLVVMAPLEGFQGKISVTVKGKVAVSEQSFQYLSPNVSTMFPERAAPGISVTFTGANFSPVVEYNTVTFGGVQAEIVSASSTQLVVTIPEGTSGNELRVDNGHATSVSVYDVCGNGTELVPYDPQITNVTSNGETFTLTFKILNAGNQSADLANVTVMGSVSDDDVTETLDPDIPDSPLAGTVASGDIFDVSVVVNLPAGISVEDHPYITIISHITPGTLDECYNGNNVMQFHYE